MLTKIFFIIFVLISVLFAWNGLTSLSEATLGVGLLASGILFAAWARILQAAYQHEEMKQAVGESRGN